MKATLIEKRHALYVIIVTVLVIIGVTVFAYQPINAQDDSEKSIAVGTAQKVVVFVEENHSYSQMKAGMPYLNSLAQKYGYATNWTATTHPSLPNYLAMAGGSTFGVTSNGGPSTNGPKVGQATSVFDEAISAGKTAKLYVEGMPSNCSLSNNSAGKYAVKHNPWPYFTSSKTRSNCNNYDVPLTSLSSDIVNNNLPNVSMVVPNLCNDAHNCSLGVADNWLKTRIGPMLTSTDFTSGALTIIVTADEDDKASGNKVLTVVMHPSISSRVVTAPMTHYSLTKYFAQVSGTTPLLSGKTAPDMKAAFGL